MPEGPEIRYIKELVEPHIINRTIISIKAFSKKRVYIPNNSKVSEVGTKGKLLWIRTGHYYIHIHFGMTGWLYLEEPEYTKYVITVMDGNRRSTNVYIDSIRKFTTLKIYKREAHMRKLNGLGIDVLTRDFTYSAFYNLIDSKNMMITKFLLDQDKLCGVGNYMKSDSLYLARIHPEARTSDLTVDQIRGLYNSIRYIAYSSLLTWLRDGRLRVPSDIRGLTPSRTRVPYRFLVYDREYDPKGNRVTMEDIGGRGTYYVKKLQKL